MVQLHALWTAIDSADSRSSRQPQQVQEDQEDNDNSKGTGSRPGHTLVGNKAGEWSAWRIRAVFHQWITRAIDLTPAQRVACDRRFVYDQTMEECMGGRQADRRPI